MQTQHTVIMMLTQGLKLHCVDYKRGRRRRRKRFVVSFLMDPVLQCFTNCVISHFPFIGGEPACRDTALFSYIYLII